MRAPRTLLAACAGVLLTTGCYRDSAAPSATAPPSSASSGARDLSATITDPVGFLPADSQYVMGVDLHQLRASPLWPLVAPRLDFDKLSAQLKIIDDACGFSLLASIGRMTAGTREDNGQVVGVLVVHGLPRDKVEACLARSPADSRVRMDSGTLIITAGTRTVVARFVDPQTVVAQVSTGPATAAQLDKTLAARSPLRGVAELSDKFAQLDTGAALWALIRPQGTSLNLASLAPTAIWGSLDASSGLRLTGRIELADAAAATQLASGLQSQVASLQAMLDRFEITVEGAQLAVDVELTEAQVTLITQLLGMATPAQPLPSGPPQLPTP